jgi:anti-sigma regulatory factor (Ser/Thr protein kinase)
VESDDEIGELAKAFSTIQQVTVSVAEEQSELLKKGIGDLYVNLARRNQSLLDRQISLLDDMEATVEDADELSSLFELDHLATRMRRNAESLLVMSGASQPRQWGTAIPVLDVVRAAAAEIADFARVTYFGFEGDTAVAGNAVSDVTHLLAELLENATAFSPPDTPVVVAGRAVDRRYIVTITDEGIGMDEPRVAAANALLARPPAPGLTLSRTLGLHVVAHLASRYGIGVQLRRAPSSGLTAVVALPITVLARAGEPVAEAPAPPARERAEPVRAEPVDAGVVDPLEVARSDRPAPMPDDAPREARPMPAAVGAPSGTPDDDAIAWRSETTTEAPSSRARADDAPPDERDLPRRAPAATEAPVPNGNGNGHGAGDGAVHVGPEIPGDGRLTTRTPGANLTHQPGATAGRSSGEVRPRPERVHDLLSRHERGKRDGRVRAPEGPSDMGEDGR